MIETDVLWETTSTEGHTEHLLIVFNTWGYETQHLSRSSHGLYNPVVFLYIADARKTLLNSTLLQSHLYLPYWASVLLAPLSQCLSGIRVSFRTERFDQCGCKQRRLRRRRTGGRKREKKPPSLLLLLFTSPWPHLALYTATYCCSVQRSG